MKSMENYKRLLRYIKPYWKRLAIAMACMAGVAAMTGASALVVKNVLDDIFIKKNDLMLAVIPFAIVSIFALKGAFFYAQGYLMAYIGQSTIREIRDELYAHLHKQSLSFFYKNPTGTLMSRITYDVSLINESVSNAFSSLLRDSFSIIALIGVVFYRDWGLAIMAVVVYPLALYPIIRFGKKLRRYGTESQETMGYINSFLHETIAGARIVKAFGMEKYEAGRFARENKKFFDIFMKVHRVRVLSPPIMELLASFGIAAIVWYGGFKVIDDRMTTGEFFSFLTALIMLYQPVKKLSSVNNTIQESLAAADRIFELLDTKPEITDRENAVSIDAFRNEIELRKISFRYESDNVIKGLSLLVKKGERIAIVGSSGAGKSTLLNLIPRFYDVTGGEILIDNHDIRDLTIESLRALTGIVTQETVLFNDTVASNISYGRGDMPEEKIISAAKAAYAHDFILELPQGYQTQIGEQGTRLSGGQRQRISIARAILKNAPILILDEATSALDTESEKIVQGALNNLMKSRTTLVIAHRLSTVMDADRIAVMDKGRIVEIGSHPELIEKGGIYKRLCDMQLMEEPDKEGKSPPGKGEIL